MGRAVCFPMTRGQGEAYRDLETPTILFVGGLGSGKSVTGALKAWQLSEVNAPVPTLFVEPTYQQIQRVAVEHIRAIFRRWGLWRFATYNKNERSIEWPCRRGTARIWLINGSDPENAAGPNAGAAVIDEAGLSKIHGDFKTQIYARVRDRNAQVRQIVNVGTPDMGKRGWFYEESLKPRNEVHVIRAKTTDNYFNPPGYADKRLAGLDDVNRRRYCDGEFIDFYGRVYTHFEDRHVKQAPTDEEIRDRFGEHIMFCDFGSGIMAWGFGVVFKIGSKEILHVTGEQVLEGGGLSTITARDKAKQYLAEEFTRIYGRPFDGDEAAQRTKVYCDASGDFGSATDVAILEQGGFRVRHMRRNPRVMDRVNCVQNKLFLKELFIDEHRAPYITRCLRLQGYDEKGEPEKGRAREGSKGLDHGADALGYAVAYRWPIETGETRVIDVH